MPAKPLTPEQKADAARLRAIFESRKSGDPSLTQESLAYACEWKTQGAVNQYLNGKIPLNVPALLKFSKALRVRPEEISPALAKQMQEVASAVSSPSISSTTDKKSEQVGRVGKAIRKMREEKGLTLSEVESRAGLSEGNLSRIERGEQWLSEEKLFALAAALDVSPADFFSSGEHHAQPDRMSGQSHLTPIPTSDYISVKELNELASAYVNCSKEDRELGMNILRSGAEKAAARSRRAARKKL